MSKRANMAGLKSACIPFALAGIFLIVQGVAVKHWFAFWPVFAFALMVAPILFFVERDAEDIRILTKKNDAR